MPAQRGEPPRTFAPAPPPAGDRAGWSSRLCSTAPVQCDLYTDADLARSEIADTQAHATTTDVPEDTVATYAAAGEVGYLPAQLENQAKEPVQTVDMTY